MRHHAFRVLSLGLALCGLLGSRASAQESYDEQLPPTRKFISSERFAIEFRIGPYQPNMGANDAFDTFFGGDHGPLFGLELDVIGYRVPDIVYVCAGGRFGSAGYDGKSLDSSGMQTAENVTLSYLPLDALAVVRVDALARKLSVPLIVTGKLGYEWAHWTTQTGKFAEKAGWSVGPIWGAQLGLDLDTFDRKAARTMDEEWGINHSFLFFELFHFHPSSNSLPLGSMAWAAGLGFMF